MPLTFGSRLGPYEVTAQIGVGGMGEVYRATDTNLGRQVAIKVLPEAFAQDAERLARFDREAKTLAALNHPNIAAIYGLERADGHTALVMELVEGPTLADRIAEGPIRVDQAVTIATQIAGALEGAHEQGIVHRDLKPANIKLREDGTVKVLDFGLAKTMEGGAGARVDLSNSPTIMSPAMTRVGILLGTAAYMSPEQATGRPVDRRSDIWAFGCVLYEMLTGRRTFGGATATETLAAILERDVDWTKLPATTPQSVRTVLRRALEKDPRRRLHDIADARIELDDSVPAPTTASSGNGRQSTVRWLSALVATSVAVGLAAGSAVWHFKPAAPLAASGPAAVSRLVIAAEGPVPAEGERVMALSPDGRRLAYVVTSGGRQGLYLRDLDQFEGRPIPGTDGAESPAFSPDGKWLAFAAEHEIKKVAVAGGMPVPLCESVNSRGLSWESNDAILFGEGTRGIFRVSAAGGKPSALTTLGTGEFQEDFPEILPGGKALLYSNSPGGVGTPQVVAWSLETGVRRVIAAGASARYLATGHLVYVQGGTLFAVPFDAVRLEPRGDPTVVLQGVRQTQFGAAQIAYSEAGTMTYIPATGVGRQDTLVWVDGSGLEQPTALSGLDFSMPRVAPDLRRVVLVSQKDVWLYDLTRDTRSRLTFDEASLYPLWAPTGMRLAYRSDRAGRPEIYMRTLDGSVPEERFPTSQDANIPLSWSPDGRFLAAVSVSAATANDIWVYPVEDRREPLSFVRTKFREGAPTFSPDSRWIAYGSEQSGRGEIYMRPFPGPGEEWTISTDGGSEPVWARKAGRLFYRQGDAMMAVDITTSPTVVVGKPRRLFERPYKRSSAFWPNYDVAPDGQRLLMVKGGAQEDSSRINVVLNWQEELKRLLPTK